MLGNVVLLCFFVFFVFAIVGVQLWNGLLRNRCFHGLTGADLPNRLPLYYEQRFPPYEYICSVPKDSGMHTCNNLEAYRENETIVCAGARYDDLDEGDCVNWYQYYNDCRPDAKNPFGGAISFDNILYALVTVFVLLALNGWVDIMYYVQDAHSFWNWAYFVTLIVDKAEANLENREKSEESKDLDNGLNCLQKIRQKIRQLVDSSVFGRGIMIAIIVNTVTMAVEHHNQPFLLTAILEYSNYFFTGLFAVEMVLKLTACGPSGYVQDTFNIFDGTIVIVSLIELVQGGEGGLSVLRTFRLFRVFKLVRFIPSLRYQLVIMIKCVNNVTFFFVLLCLFIFIFTLLGMVLFGGKFCYKETDLGEIPCNCSEIVQLNIGCQCLRWNFDTFLHAALTVFVVLSGCWCTILYDGMARVGVWSALYFISLLAFGNYILFNLLVGILLEGFQDTNEDEVNAEVDDEELDEEESMIEGEIMDQETVVCTCNLNDLTATLANDQRKYCTNLDKI